MLPQQRLGSCGTEPRDAPGHDLKLVSITHLCSCIRSLPIIATYTVYSKLPVSSEEVNELSR